MQKFCYFVLVFSVSSLVVGHFKSHRLKHTTLSSIVEHGYPAEYHRVITGDGNVVVVFRIPYSPKLHNMNAKRPIVLLQHGLMSSSDTWIASGPNNALAYLLVDAGFDVWIGNTRGNVYSRKAKKPSWKFSWHEIGYIDMASIIDYALWKNGQRQKSLHYVGHSQGTTVFFVLMSLRPQYNEKIKTAHMLAPVAIMKNINSECLRCIAYVCRPGSLMNYLLSDEASITWKLELIMKFLRKYNCPLLANIFHEKNMNKTANNIAIRHFPSGGSNNQILHYLFNIQSGEFRQYDYGPRKNIRKYSSKRPPLYPVERIKSETHLWYSDADTFTPVVDVLTLARRLPKSILHRMPDPKWSHSAFTVHMQVRRFVNDPIIAIMKRYEQKKT
ncbi:lipase 3-like [Drosophila sulfurigaster albostrigata]|uniref:lipase 3-like n=1 Tax=Drosophila sulfurigaster albostrigata TaxID=89887 RepID=UPI002D21AF46|nr:lipase 3-like [Drosophila sulfurigaster albostrigata]